MKIRVESSDGSPGQTHEAIAAVKAGFVAAGENIARVIVRLSSPADRKHAVRQCAIEVHMADGHVEVVQERQRHLGAALRRAVSRAWDAVAQRLRAEALRWHPPLVLPA